MKHTELINDPALNRTVYLFVSPEEKQLTEKLKELPANFILLEAENWNDELSPWPLKAGKMRFREREIKLFNSFLTSERGRKKNTAEAKPLSAAIPWPACSACMPSVILTAL